jgi:hypothetical protein
MDKKPTLLINSHIYFLLIFLLFALPAVSYVSDFNSGAVTVFFGGLAAGLVIGFFLEKFNLGKIGKTGEKKTFLNFLQLYPLNTAFVILIIW